jgi:transcription elongation GreA/GreB family factor
MNMRLDLPSIVLGTHDYNRLTSMAALHSQQNMPYRGFLISELRRASICHPKDLPEDVVSTNSRVTYRLNGIGKLHSRVLVYPDDLLWPGAELSVTTPLGIALLGLRVGDRMSFETSDNRLLSEVLVEDVGFRLLADETELAQISPGTSAIWHENSDEDLDRRLDDALMETFPASDPVSVIVCGRP